MKVSPIPRPEGLVEGKVVFDIGPGLQPIGWYKPERHICVEPFGPYADRLEAAGYEVIRMTAREALQTDAHIDAIYMLDVIEHMTREEGEEVLALATGRGAQIVLSTPHGYHKQHTDEWDLGGEHWQTHRSGWVPADFPGWSIQPYNVRQIRIGFTAVSP